MVPGCATRGQPGGFERPPAPRARGRLLAQSTPRERLLSSRGSRSAGKLQAGDRRNKAERGRSRPRLANVLELVLDVDDAVLARQLRLLLAVSLLPRAVLAVRGGRHQGRF